MATAPSSSIANGINEFTTHFEQYFDDHILAALSTEVGSYYALFGFALTAYLTYLGIRITLGLVEGKDTQGAVMQIVFSLMFLLFGYTLIPAMDYFGEVAVQGISHAMKLNDASATQNTIDKFEALEKIQNEEYQLSETDIKNVKEAQAKVDRYEHQSAQIDNATEFHEDQKSQSVWGWIKGGVASFFANIFLFIGAMCKMIITFFILLIKGLLRVTFPIAVCLSLILKADKALEAWWESYITVVMMGVIVAAISGMQQLMLTDFASTSLDAAQLGIGVMGLAFGAAYMCAPTLTVLCFGGSQAAAQLPQQISSAMVGVISLSWTYTKVASILSGKVATSAYDKIASTLNSTKIPKK